MIDVRKLRMLTELERLGTIAAVAAELNLTAPGISMQLAALEREVGLSLTERAGRRVVLTPAGVMLARHGREIVDRLSLAEFEAASLRDGLAGEYRVAAFPSAVRTVVADAWARILEQPEWGITLVLSELEPQAAIPALAAGRVDLAVTHAYSNIAAPSEPTLVAEPVAVENVWLATAATADVAPVSLAGFADHNWIVPDSDLACFEMVQRACGVAGFAPRVVAEATDFSAQLALVGAGVGVALVPDLAVASLPEGVALRPLAVPVLRHHFIVTRTSSQTDAGLRRLVGIMADAAQRVVRAPTPERPVDNLHVT